MGLGLLQVFLQGNNTLKAFFIQQIGTEHDFGQVILPGAVRER